MTGGGGLDGLKGDRTGGIGQGVAGTGLAQPHHGHDIPGKDLLDLLALVGVHLQEPADALLVALVDVQDLLPGGQHSGVEADKGEVAHIGVVDDLEGQGGQGVFVPGRAGDLVAVLEADHGVNLERGGQIVHHPVEEGLDTLVLERRAAHNRNHAERGAAQAQAVFDLGGGQLLAGQVAVGELLVVLGRGFDQLDTHGFGLVPILRGDLLDDRLGAGLAVVVKSLHVDQIDHAYEFLTLPKGELEQNRPGSQAFLDHSDHPPVVGPDPVHFVDESDPWNPVLVGLSPDRLGLWFHAAHSTKNSYHAVKHAQGPLHLNGEVHMARGVDYVNSTSAPEAGCCGRGDCDTPFLLLDHVVHRGLSVVDLADPM